MILQGDVIEKLKEIPDDSVQCVVTSPPYWGLRDYGVKGQLGLEDTPEEFVANMVAVFREVRRVLRKDGTLWLNIGDSYANRSSAGKGSPTHRDRRKDAQQPHMKIPAGLKSKELIGIPWRLAFALQDDGWYLRQDIIWSKSNPMPESIKDRCTKSHEYMFLLTKSARYHFDHEAIKEPAVYGNWGSRLDWESKKSFPDEKKNGIRATGRFPSGWARGDQPHTSRELQTDKEHRKTRPSAKRGEFTGKTGDLAFRAVTDMRNKRSVWNVATRPYKGAHFATFPEKLIEPCILAGCPPRGFVLDPFFGSGTTGAVAKRLGRNYIGIELNPEYIKLAEERINAVKLSPEKD